MNPQASSSAVAPDTAPLRPRPASRFLAAFHAYAGWLVGISWWRFLLRGRERSGQQGKACRQDGDQVGFHGVGGLKQQPNRVAGATIWCDAI